MRGVRLLTVTSIGLHVIFFHLVRDSMEDDASVILDKSPLLGSQRRAVFIALLFVFSSLLSIEGHNRTAVEKAPELHVVS